ncbi:phosphotransferase [Pantoea sp.]|uniref:phosphotransferase n=1 Tax=Pantoea sp. TaxID=69393 RepID=UPI0031D9AA8B
MENLRTELTLVLGEDVSRLETLSEHAQTRLYALYDNHGEPMPLVAKYYRQQGRAALEARKLALLGQESVGSVPAVLGLVLSQQPPVHEMLLMSRLAGVSAAETAGTESLRQQILETLLVWHGVESQGLVGNVDSVQRNSWPAWYRQRVEVLWATLGYRAPAFLTLEDRQILFRSRDQLAKLFHGFADPCVLLHGNLRLSHVRFVTDRDPQVAMVNPGDILWGPREFELRRLSEQGEDATLLQNYLQRAPVSEGFLWRRWLYQLWDCIECWMDSGQFDRPRFDYARQQLLPWLV